MANLMRDEGKAARIAVSLVLVLLGGLVLFDSTVGSRLVQLATLAVLAVTLWNLKGYASDTKRLARMTAEQRDLTHQPCVVINRFSLRDATHIAAEKVHEKLEKKGMVVFPGVTPARPSAAVLPTDLHLENVGAGPALGIEFRKVDATGDRDPAVFIPHLKVGQEWRVVLAPKEEESWGIEIEYAAMSGIRFVSTYTLEGEVVRDFSTRKRETAGGE